MASERVLRRHQRGIEWLLGVIVHAEERQSVQGAIDDPGGLYGGRHRVEQSLDARLQLTIEEVGDVIQFPGCGQDSV